MIAKLEPEFMPMAKVINDYKEAVAKAVDIVMEDYCIYLGRN